MSAFERGFTVACIVSITISLIFILKKIGLSVTDIALSCIALMAVVVAVWQGVESRNHNKLSVRPWLEFEWADGKEAASSKLILYNNGFGPAIVSEIRVSINDGPLEMLTVNGVLAIWNGLGCERAHARFPDQDGTCLRKGDNIVLIDGLPPLREGSALKKLRAAVIYKSMYGDVIAEPPTLFE